MVKHGSMYFLNLRKLLTNELQGPDLNELKTELNIDDHKITIEVLCERYGSDPEQVRFIGVNSFLFFGACKYTDIFKN